jgi:signal transduction histidine kinase
MSNHAHSLRHRIAAAFLLSATLIALLFSLFNFVFLYAVEDRAFAHMLDEEAAHQRQHWQRHGEFTAPLRDYVALHRSPDSFPAAVKEPLIEEPNRREFFGDDGKHYHLAALKFQPGQAQAYLLAEVSAYLLVRPIRNRMLVFYAISALIVLSIAGLIGYLLAGRATAPLTRLVQMLDEVEPDTRPAPFATAFAGTAFAGKAFPDNEIGKLATALEQAFARGAAFLEREQNFTRDASHELRTPIAIIHSAAELLAMQQLPEAGREQLQQIRAAAIQMEQIVNTLLALAREAPKTAQPPVMLLPILEKAIVQHANLLRDKDVQLDVQIPARATVALPAPVLSILLNNLIANAFQYTPSGVIGIGWQDRALEIHDSGPGIEDDIVERLGEPLVKGSASTGFGLGLSIVKRLCDRFDLVLSISPHKNGGTRAEVRFPA